MNSNHIVRQGHPRIYFSGNNLDPVDCNSLAYEIKCLAEMAVQQQRQLKVMLVPISKSGTTLETISAFTYFYYRMEKKSCH